MKNRIKRSSQENPKAESYINYGSKVKLEVEKVVPQEPETEPEQE